MIDLVGIGNLLEHLVAVDNITCEERDRIILRIAKENDIAVLRTTHSIIHVSREIYQAIPIRTLMSTNTVTFDSKSFVDDVYNRISKTRFRSYPVVNEENKVIGQVSRYHLLASEKKKFVLVDHNEFTQSIDDIDSGEVVEIIDHHRLGTVETISPVFFRNQPLGCTATIVYQMYQEAGIEIEKQIAGLLCSAIISDTLLFRSPTCTAVDRAAAMKLADIAGVEIEKYAGNMFAAGSNLKGKNDSEIFYQDFKTFTAGKTILGVAQVSSLNEEELADLRERMGVFIKQAKADRNMDMMFFMLTNIVTESTDLIYEGQGAEQLVIKAFHLENDGASEEQNWITLPGVVSRKKQLVPALVLAEQE